MDNNLPSADRKKEFARFASERVAPFAEAADRTGCLSDDVIDALSDAGYLGALVSPEYGGMGMSQAQYGELTAEIARSCSATRTLLTVHGLVTTSVARWGSDKLKGDFLRRFTSSAGLTAFAMSEANAGSDAKAIELSIQEDGADLLLFGEKRWISFGARAAYILVFGVLAGASTAVLVNGDCPNLIKEAVPSMVGTRGAMMANLRFDGCRVPKNAIVGRPGFGVSHVAATALDFGRYSVAWGSIGIIEACVRKSLEFSNARYQFDKRIKDHPQVAARITKMLAVSRVTRLLATEAGRLRDEGSPDSLLETMLAKYAASKGAVYAANEAIQIHGARGLLTETGLERLLRDAKVTEIIEGSSDVLETMICSLISSV
ncbi:acyl-CoA dehydrogenase family protein [Massilia sp. Root335]|uniref:acyl-CoA dehydrogenase family protein n=1 Tax=Massilia sp. Root335 TaxID=1736517 RepID=UPI000AFDB21F|nr:acyl-CoA dehydrogenase family protein [Massilia sp. Root335]